jgi:hypothetical protein
VVTDDEEKYKKKLGNEQRDAVSNLESFYMKITLYSGKASKVQLVVCEHSRKVMDEISAFILSSFRELTATN